MNAPVDFAALAIAAGPAGSGCGQVPCETPNGCGSGHTMPVFHGASRETVKLTKVEDLGATIAEHIVPVTGPVTSVVVCRASWSADRDDVVVDSIEGVCP